MYKCPNKNLPEWKELERVVPEVAWGAFYTVLGFIRSF